MTTEQALDFSLKKPVKPELSPQNSPQGSDRSRQSPSSTTPSAGAPHHPSNSNPLFFPGSLGNASNLASFFGANSGFQPFLKKPLCPTPPFMHSGTLPDPFSPPAPPWMPPATPSLLSNIPDPAFFPTASLALSTIHRRRRSGTSTSGSEIGGSSSPSGLGEPSPKRLAKGVPDEQKDDLYWERRRKNNEAAKRSRDTRRAKEEEIAMRAAILEQENLKLRAQVAVLKNETAKLHFMLFNQASNGATGTSSSNRQILA